MGWSSGNDAGCGGGRGADAASGRAHIGHPGGARAPARAATLALTAAALTGFAANSLLCRAALRPNAIDAASFTLVRIAAGAIVLAVLMRATQSGRPPAARGSWRAATALFAYAIAFSLAYLRLDAGTGAWILFGVVQATMILAGMRAGERLRVAQWLGLALALGGLALLTRPGTSAPDPLGAALMALAGVAWGVYSLLGRRTSEPLAATAHNFARAVPLALLASAISVSAAHAAWRGVALAAASGALASGIGYSLWYAALRGLRATQAAVVQLAVPVLAAIGGVLLLGEPATARLAVSGAAILAGVGLAVWKRR